MVKISIVIPFHNEEKNLKILIPKLIKELIKIKKHKFNLWLIDDKSDDNSFKICKNLKNLKNIKFKCLKLQKRSGQTGAYKKAFRHIKNKYLIRMDSDLQDRPEDIKLFIKYIEKDYDLIIGIRKLSISSSVLNVCSFIYNRAFRYILNCNLTILSSSFVAFKFKYLTNLPWYKNDHRYLPAIAIDRGAKKLKQIKIKHQKRKFGHSKYNTFKKIFFGIPEVIIFFFRLKLKSYK